MKGTSHWKGGDDLYCSLLPLRAERHTGPAKPALLRIHLNGRLPFSWIRSKGITHTNLNTYVAPGTSSLIEIDVFETHSATSHLNHRNSMPEVPYHHSRKCIKLMFESVLPLFSSSTGPVALADDLIEWPLNEDIPLHNIHHTSIPLGII
jgi:hypothetical protein